LISLRYHDNIFYCIKCVVYTYRGLLCTVYIHLQVVIKCINVCTVHFRYTKCTVCTAMPVDYIRYVYRQRRRQTMTTTTPPSLPATTRDTCPVLTKVCLLVDSPPSFPLFRHPPRPSHDISQSIRVHVNYTRSIMVNI